MTNSAPSHCPRCNIPIPANAPSGLCPACVLGGAATASGRVFSSAKSQPPSVEEIAVHFPDLEVKEMIGFGGMGVVYKARQPKLDRLVALKILHVHDDDPSFEERFNREARVLARLNHPNIVTVFDFGTSGPFHFLIMELIDGVNLRQAMQAGRFTPDEALTLVQEMCAALKSAHEDGILHRDIKPENILLDSQGRLKIADFGIAKIVGADEANNFTLTRQDSILGSPQYMAPEQIESPDDVDQRADIYSLGVVFYELLTGELPLGRFAAPSSKNDVDSRIDEIVFRTLEKERDARFQSADEVSTKVDALSQSPPLPPASRTDRESGVARHASLAAICTGISLPAVAFALMAFLSVKQVPSTMSGEQPQNTDDVLFVLSVIAAILAIITPPLGFFLGLGALGDIRQSGGQKQGLNRSTFAVVTWPILVSLALFTALLPGPIPMPIFFLVLFFIFIALCWSIAPPVRRWARNESDSLSPIFKRLLLSIGIPVLMLSALIIWMKTPRDSYRENGSPISSVGSFSAYSSNDIESRRLAGKLEAASQLRDGPSRALAIAKLAKEAAMAGEYRLAEAACEAIFPYGIEKSERSLTNTTRYQCALILGRAGYTSEATNLASKINGTLKQTALLKISTGDFEDNSIPPLDN